LFYAYSNFVLGLDAIVDAIGNVVIYKPAHAGCEDKPTVALQAHYDMVCVADSGVVHDFKKDCIKPRIEGDWYVSIVCFASDFSFFDCISKGCMPLGLPWVLTMALALLLPLLCWKINL
jgi:hypothetical protein